MPFDLNQLLQDPSFAMGMTLLSGNQNPNVMATAYETANRMDKLKLAKEHNQQQYEIQQAEAKRAEEQSRLYARQVKTAEENAARQAKADADYNESIQPIVRQLLQRYGGSQQPMGGQNAPQFPQSPAGNSAFVAPQQQGGVQPPPSLFGAADPPAKAQALVAADSAIENLNKELQHAGLKPGQREILQQELTKVTQYRNFLNGLPQQQAPGSNLSDAQTMQMIGGLTMGMFDPKKRGEGLVAAGKAMEPQFGKPGDVNLNTGEVLPDAALDYRKTHDAAEMARKQQEFRDTERRLQGQADSEDANRKSISAERDAVRREREGKAYAAHQALDLSLNQMYDTAKRLKENPNLDAITGTVMGRIPSIRQGSVNAEAEREHLTGQVFVNASQAFRRMNETGGSVGQQSDWEGKQFVDAWGRLSKLQGTPAYKEGLDKLMVSLRESQLRMKAAYDYYHGKKKGEVAPEQFKRVVQTGKQDGKRVVKFEDGSIDFID